MIVPKPTVIQMGQANSMGHRTKWKAMDMGKRSARKKGCRQKWDRNKRKVRRIERIHMHETAREQKFINEQNISE